MTLFRSVHLPDVDSLVNLTVNVFSVPKNHQDKNQLPHYLYLERFLPFMKPFSSGLLRAAANPAMINMVLSTVHSASDSSTCKLPDTLPEFIPETKGLTLSGKVLNKTTNQPARGENVYFSTIDSICYLKHVVTDSTGNFYFSLNGLSGQKQVVIQLDENKENLLIKTENEYSTVFKFYNYVHFFITDNEKEWIRQRMVQQQVQEAYSNRDFVSLHASSKDFFYLPDDYILLSDYIQLPVFNEIIIELTKKAIVSNKNGNKMIEVLDKYNNQPLGKNPFYFIDGLLVFDGSKILSLDPSEVYDIQIVAANYFFGNLEMDGIFSLRTKNMNLAEPKLPSNAIYQVFEGIQPEASFSQPNTNRLNQSHLPDFRSTLYWNPSFCLSKNKSHSFRFYTSDVQGDFRIVVQGISNSGKPFYATNTFNVSK